MPRPQPEERSPRRMPARPSRAINGESAGARIHDRPVDLPIEFRTSSSEAGDRQVVTVRAEMNNPGGFGVRRRSGMPGGETGCPDRRGSRELFRMRLGSPPVRYAKNSLPPAHRRRRGVTAVEFALILPLLMTIVLGCVDYGRFAYDYIAVTNAARAGASYAIMNNYSPSTLATWQTGVRQAARDEMALQSGYVSGNLTVPDPDVISSTRTACGGSGSPPSTRSPRSSTGTGRDSASPTAST